MSLVHQRSSRSLPNLFGFAKRSFKSLRLPGEPLDPSSSSPILSFGIHVFHAPVSHLSLTSHIAVAFIFSFSLFYFLGNQTEIRSRKWVCLLFCNRMLLELWPSCRIALPPKAETYSAPASSSPKISTCSIPEGIQNFLRFHFANRIKWLKIYIYVYIYIWFCLDGLIGYNWHCLEWV